MGLARRWRSWTVLSAGCVVGCLGEPLVDADDGSTTALGMESTGTSAPGTSVTPTSASSDDAGATDSGGDESSTTVPTGCQGFICPPDWGDVPPCSLWNQDCPPGEKCMPWSNDGGGWWNATRCSEIDPTPAAAGDPCSVVGSATSGIDDCGLGAMCWDVDPDTNMGTCVDFCEGSEAEPTCADPVTECTMNGDGTLILCLPGCNPLAADCDDGEGCYPVGEGFACSPDAGGGSGFGAPCEFLNGCTPGLFCAEPELVPGCEGASGCCSGLCDLAADDPDAMCWGAAQGQVCVPWYQPGQAPPGLVDLGLCALPE